MTWSEPTYFPKSPLPNTLERRTSKHEFREDKNTQSIAKVNLCHKSLTEKNKCKIQFVFPSNLNMGYEKVYFKSQGCFGQVRYNLSCNSIFTSQKI